MIKIQSLLYSDVQADIPLLIESLCQQTSHQIAGGGQLVEAESPLR